VAVPEHTYSSWKTTDCGSGSFTLRHPGNSSKSAGPSTVAATVADLMSRDIDFCTPDCSVQAVACMMAGRNVGSIPVVNNTDHLVPIGVMTDRDIVLRVVANGQDPSAIRVDQCMSLDVPTVPSTAPASDAAAIMQRHRLNRLPVVDDTGCLVGIVSQADLTRPTTPAQTAEAIRELSEPVA
jgi:CBS domain-containing protein